MKVKVLMGRSGGAKEREYALHALVLRRLLLLQSHS
jgi:hypothetical protein